MKFILDIRLVMFALILSFSLLIAQAFLAQHFLARQYGVFSETNTNRLESAAIAALELTDAEQLERYLEKYDTLENIEDDEEHQKLRRALIHFAETHKLKFVYFLRRIDENNFQYIIDNDMEEPISPSDTNKLYRILRIAFETGAPAADLYGEYEEDWEGLISAYVPFYDTQGNLVFAAGVDIEDTDMVSARRNLSFLSIVQIIIILTTLAGGITIIVMFRKKALQSEQSSISKSNFFATISHEIRTPLNSILGLTEIELNNANLPKQTSDNLKQIRLSGNQLLKIINEIVDLSKIDTGKFIISQEKYDTGSFINDIITAGFIKYSNKGIELKCKVSPHIPTLLSGDVLHIKKIVDNMLSNAFKYTIKGSVTINFSFEKENESNGFLVISIEDTGIGIKKDDIIKLNGYYTQINASANRQFYGLGIGLTMCMKLIKLMKGNLYIGSEFEKGSKFTIKVPQGIMSDNEIGEDFSKDLMDFSCEDIDKNKSMLDKYYMPYGKVLVVDDVQTNLDVAKGYMSIYGLHVDCVLSGADAIEKIKNADVIYDCIFMDHMMPGMDGIEAFKKIRNEIGTDYAKTVPIVAFTANASAGNEEMFLENGFNDFMSKPIDSQKLYKILNKFVREKQNEQTLKYAEEEHVLILESREQTNGILAKILRNTQIDGIDLADTLNKFSGDFDAYFSAIQSFMKYAPNVIKQIKETTPQVIKEYAVIIHGIKGSCYGIGAKECGNSAKELEAAAKNDNFEEISAKNAAFVTKLEKIIEDLQNLAMKIEKQKNKSDDRKTEPKPSVGLLADLLDAAKNHDIYKMDAVMNSLNAFKYKEQGDLVKELSELVRDFKYDDVTEKLKDLFQG